MEKRTVLITGAAKGIGECLARGFATAGYNIAINYLNSVAQAKALDDSLKSGNVNCMSLCCDVSDYDSVALMYQKTKERFGFVDTVINNAGIGHYKLFCDEKTADFDAVINANLRSVFNICSVYSPDMVSNRFGRIINISSIFGVSGASMEVLYSMSKSGVIGLTKALGKELAPNNVTVNAIAPGLIDTDMNRHLSHKELECYIDSIPVNRIGQPSDILSAALFLADKNSAFITGEVININGGVL